MGIRLVIAVACPFQGTRVTGTRALLCAAGDHQADRKGNRKNKSLQSEPISWRARHGVWIWKKELCSFATQPRAEGGPERSSPDRGEHRAGGGGGLLVVVARLRHARPARYRRQLAHAQSRLRRNLPEREDRHSRRRGRAY